MKYPNAYSGVKKLFTAEVLSIIGVILLICASAFGLIAVAAGIAAGTVEAEAASSLADAAVGFGIPTVICGVGGAVLLLIAYILQIVGVGKAKKDEPMFKNAFLFIFIGIISTAITTITGSLQTMVTGVFGQRTVEIFNVIFSNLSKIATILVMFYIITGIISLAEKIGNEKVANKGRTVINLIMVILVISLLATITANVFPKTGTNDVLLSILAVASLVIDVIAYIIYLTFLSKAKKMLKEATE